MEIHSDVFKQRDRIRWLQTSCIIDSEFKNLIHPASEYRNLICQDFLVYFSSIFWKEVNRTKCLHLVKFIFYKGIKNLLNNIYRISKK
jgi:hypothetical protein